jgi:transcriptional regulator with XRE-family HTH domain
MQQNFINKQHILHSYKIIGNNVKRLRMSKNISQLSLSLAIGHKAVGTISMCELCINGKHFNIEHLIKISQVLDVPICEFFKGIDEIKENEPILE